MNKDKFDVIVVGAGPSGSTVANFLASKGIRTLLIDNGDIGRDKACGGFIPNSVIKEFHIPDAVIDRTICRLRAYYEALETETEIDKSGSVLRTDFDKFLLERAIREGTNFLPKTRAVDIQYGTDGHINGIIAKNLISGKLQKIKSTVVVDAEGYSANLAKKIGLFNHWAKYAVCRQYIMSPAKPIEKTFGKGVIETYWDIEGPGYAWIFPKRDRLYVGIGIETPPPVRDIKVRLDSFINSHVVASKKLKGCKIIALNGGVVTTSGPYSPTYTSNFIVTGEAAGCVGPLYGGGIDYGMFSAKIAADVVADAISTGDTSSKSLSKYEKRCCQINGPYLKREMIVKKIVLRSKRWKRAFVENFNSEIAKKTVRLALSRSERITTTMRLKLILSLSSRYIL